MTIDRLGTYLPMDRRRALAIGESVPADATGSALLADISGFTPLTEALVEGLGERRGAEELTGLLNEVYTSLVSRVHHFGGSVICFIGDALISFFPGDDGLRGVACGLQMQRVMAEFRAIASPQGGRVSLTMKAAVTAGPTHRHLIGDPEILRMDVLTGETIDRLADAEHLAEPGEVIAAPEVVRRVGRQLMVADWRGRHAVVEGVRENVRPSPWPELPSTGLTADRLAPYVHGPVFDRIAAGQGEFLAELRPVSVIFLRFTGIDYDVDPDAGTKLDAFMRWVQATIDRYGGHVLLLTTADKGSHLYVAFGALAAHEDDRQRAVAAAMRLVDAPGEFDFIDGIQIGVSHGRARVGAYGGDARRTYGALGDAVNLAARLMQAAPIGEIRCSTAIHEAAKDRFAFDALPAMTLKGIDRPQPVFRPRGRVQPGQDTNRAPSELVGRRAELSVITRCLDEVAAGGRRILLIEGEAGIGKSRLIEETVRRARAEGFTTLLGEADAIERHTPYRAWRDVLSAFFGLHDVDAPEARRDRVLDRVAALDPGAVERAALLNDILELGLAETSRTRGYAPEIRQESLAALVGDLLARRAADGPLLIALEDAHWLDSLSWELVVSATRSLAQRAVLVLITHRPHGDIAPAPCAALAAMTGAQSLALGALPPEETVQLAAARLGLEVKLLPEAVAALVADRSDGNPFFAVELLGSLRDQQRIIVENGTCRIEGDAAALSEQVPDTLEGVVLSRLDQLPAEEQLTVKVASVVGRSFLVRTVASVHPARPERPEVWKHFDHTTRRRLTVLESEEPEPGFAFQHAVTHHVAYDTLLFEQRRDLHRSVAGWYEATFADGLDPYVALLAVHWNRAGHSEKECVYVRRAGEQAAARHANAEAAIHFTRALELIDELDRTSDSEEWPVVLRQRARTLGLLGRVEEERADLGRLLEWTEDSDPADRGEVLLLWSDFEKRCGRFDEAKARAEEAWFAMEAVDDAVGRARALAHVGDALEGTGEFQDAREVVGRALESFHDAGDAAGQAACLKSLGVVSARLGELPAAMERFREARSLYRELGDRKGEADILGNLGALHYYLGEYERCIEYTEQAQPLFHEMGNRIGAAKCLTNLGNSYNALGAFADALEHHRHALELYEQLEDANGRADSLCNIGLAQAALGVGGILELVIDSHGEPEQLRAAAGATETSRALYDEIGSGRGAVITAFNLGTIQLCLGEPKVAEMQLAEALRLGREAGLERLLMRSLSALGRASLASGKKETSLEFSSEAIALLSEGSSPAAIEIHFTHYRVLKALDRIEEALPHLRTAYRLVLEQADAIRSEDVRNRFLDAYQEVQAARGRHRATLDG
jgi:class 3 adenylate cyclase/tetratricopeptide (TPR) repeat protein